MDYFSGFIEAKLADHIPLKQGLRHVLCNDSAIRIGPRRPYSIKTRIKTIVLSRARARKEGLADHIPLKQGLRPIAVNASDRSARLADHIPLKQGLRLTMLLPPSKLLNGSQTIFH